MKAKAIYLESGHTSTGGLVNIDRSIISALDNKNVLILNITFEDEAKLTGKGNFFRGYYTALGAKVELVSKDTRNIDELFEEAGLLYLPGGDTKKFIENIEEMGLESLISSFERVISGNSAGAYVLCKEYFKFENGKAEVFPALGIVDFCVKGHYEDALYSELKRLSMGRKIYALENNSAIIERARHGRRDFIGEVWKFQDGAKLKV